MTVCQSPAKDRRTMSDLTIRRFKADDAEETAELFFVSVRQGAKDHYDVRELRAWAPQIPDRETWLTRLEAQWVFVAEHGNQIIGMMSLRGDGCIDLAYVAPQKIGTGVAHELYGAVLAEARERGLSRLHAQASRLARRFFERQGWGSSPRNPFAAATS